MLELDRVNFQYLESDEQALINASFRVAPGQCIVLMGKSGCGKTTISRIINGLIPELYEGTLTGDCQFEGISVSETEIWRLSERIGSVFQNPKTQFFTTDVYSELAFPCENAGMPAESIQTRIQEVSQLFQITSLLEKSIFTLSGGEKQIVALASAYMLAPKLLVLDEPSSNLDIEAIQRLTGILQRLKRHGVTILVVEHRLYYLQDLADRFLLVEKGKVTKSYSAEALRQMSEEQREFFGIRTLDLTATVPAVRQSSTRRGAVVDHILTVETLCYYYPRQKKPAIQVKNLSFFSGEVVGIVGKNGAGKSTFIHGLCGLLPLKNSVILFDKLNLSEKELVQQSFLVFQDVNFQLFCETVTKELLLHAKRKELFDFVVNKLSLRPLLQRHPATLSGGEKQRVAIGSAVLSGKKVLVMDEPTSGLDLANMNQVQELVSFLASLEIMVLLVSHDLEFLQGTCGRLLHFSAGHLVADGGPEILAEGIKGLL